MKSAVILAVASLATAFVIPDSDQQLLAAFSTDKETSIGDDVQPSNSEVSKGESPIDDAECRPSVQEWLDLSVLADGIEKDVAHFEDMEIQWEGKSESLKEAFGYRKAEIKKMIEDQGPYEEEADKKNHHHHHHHHHRLAFFKKAIRKVLNIFGFSTSRADYDLLSGHGHFHGSSHHHCTDKSIYELISSNKHTKIFTRIIDHHDEIVKILNSTSPSNYTVFVPIDAAFKNMRHHPHPNISKDDVLHWLQYHISPKVFTAHDFLDVQTVPTLRHQKTKSEDPQRISTSISRKGLTLNLYSHVIRSDIEATNGIIHALDKLLIPAMPVQTVIQAVPAVFSTLELALIKTGLIDHLNSTVGGTFFTPSNDAFARLPPQVNAFLFSSAGTKYLKALLKYHAVPGHVVFTDAYYKTKSGDDDEDSVVSKKHYELPTALQHKPVMIDIRNFHRLTLITVNQRTPVAAANVPVAEGVVHVLPSVLIPPHKHHHDEQEDESNMQDLSVTEFMERLEPYLE